MNDINICSRLTICIKLLSNRYLHYLLFLFLSFNSFSQISSTIFRNSPPASGINLKDSASKSVQLQPNFLWDSRASGTVYTAFIANEIFLEWPKAGQIIQRNNSNSAPLKIQGYCTDLNVDSVRVTATVIEGGTANSKNFLVDAAGNFSGTIDLVGGDYSILIKDFYNQGNLVISPKYTKEVSRVGIGEVLLLWGHSFMEGNSDAGVASQSERARTIKTFINQEDGYFAFFQHLEEMPIVYKKIDALSVGPFGRFSWMAGPLADSLVNKLNVPVLIYSSAFGGSNLYQNKQNITNQPFGYTWFGNGVWQNNGFPFKAAQAAFSRYIPHTGVRGVVVAHGGNDNSNLYNGGDANNFQSNYEFVINRIRTVEANNTTNLAFIIGFEDGQFTLINSHIQNIITNDSNVFQGIDLRSSSTWGSWRDEGGRGHFVGVPGLEKYAQLWNNVLTTSLFNSITPKMAD